MAAKLESALLYKFVRKKLFMTWDPQSSSNKVTKYFTILMTFYNTFVLILDEYSFSKDSLLIFWPSLKSQVIHNFSFNLLLLVDMSYGVSKIS